MGRKRGAFVTNFILGYNGSAAEDGGRRPP